MPSPRALFVKLSSLGDVIHHFPAVSDLRSRRPEIAIDWAVEEAYASLVGLHPAVSRAIPVALRRLKRGLLAPSAWSALAGARKQLRERRYDWIVDTQGLLKSVAVARLARGPLFGYDRRSIRERSAARFYDQALAVPRSLHAVERNRRLVGAVFGYEPEGPPDYGLAPPGPAPAWAPSGAYVVALHATSRRDKRWPDARWAELAARLAAEGLAVVYPGGSPAERAGAERLASASKGALAAPEMTLPEAAALLARASAVIGVDTGLAHLAVALGTPTVGLYVATQPGLTGLHGGRDAVNLGGPGKAPTVDEVVRVLLGDGRLRVMARLAYNLLLWLALPLVLARLAWRARRQPGYLEHLAERFGAAPRMAGSPVIWVHAVSVGETRAAAPLLARLREDHPGASILLTHMTPTGRATGRELFGDTVTQSWLPWDHGPFVRRFLARAKPDFGVLLETEIWPNLLAECHARGIPVCLVNARLSARSAAGYARLASLTREALGHLAGIAAQTAGDAGRLEALGARDVAVTGNIKFDLAVPADTASRGEELRALFGRSRRVWVVGSTREGEEALLVDAVEAAQPPEDVLVVVVPRHPQRFDAVAGLLASRGRPLARRSLGAPVPAQARYALGDSMGEMLAYYAAADVVFVGGSLKPYGGQNLIEPCAVGRPVIFGPSTFNFESAAEAALAEGAGLRARDAAEAVAMALALLGDAGRRADMGARAAGFAQANRGALERLSEWLAPRLAATRGPARGLPARGRLP